MIVLLMGVSGSGKTTVGEMLGSTLGWTFWDADRLHSPESIAKMSRGEALTDADRAPWLAAIRARIDQALARGESAVVGCSALRERYRRELIPDPVRVRVVCLQGDYDTIAARLRARRGHFMKENMLKSQFEALELPHDALTIDVTASPEEIVGEIRRGLGI